MILTWFRRMGRAVLDLISDYSFYFRPKRRRQQAFIHQLLADSNSLPEKRLIVSLSTMPDRINRLQPTLNSLLNQTRPPDEIVLAAPTAYYICVLAIRHGGDFAPGFKDLVLTVLLFLAFSLVPAGIAVRRILARRDARS